MIELIFQVKFCNKHRLTIQPLYTVNDSNLGELGVRPTFINNNMYRTKPNARKHWCSSI